MNSNTRNIFSKTECISSEVLKDYSTGNISDEEKRKVEKHLVDCVMCNDELEGIQAFGSIEKFDESVNEIKQKILFRFGRLRQKSNAVSIIMGIAASVLIAIISGYLIMLSMKGFEKKEIAQQLELKKEKVRDIISDSIFEEESNEIITTEMPQELTTTHKLSEIESGKITTPGNVASFEKGGGSMERKIAEANTITVIEDDLEFEDEDIYDESTATINAIETIEVSEELEEDEKAAMGYAVSYDAIEEVVIKAVPTGRQEKSMAKIMLQRSKKIAPKTVAYQMDIVEPTSESPDKYDLEHSAKQAFEQNDYINAYKLFLSNINTGYESDSAFYYLAVSCFYLNYEEAAISYFNKIQSTQIFAIERKWYLANAYLKIDSVSKAIPILKELSESQNQFTDMANQKLSEIESDD